MNIIVLVWDACRLDAANEHAKFLNELREDNLWFENAVAPSRWSLPSHVSLLSGRYPSEHEAYTPYSTVEKPKLLNTLSNAGYSTHCISANGFVSPAYGFDDFFDDFRYTTSGPGFADAGDAADISSSFDFDTSLAKTVKSLIEIGSGILTQPKPIKTSVNLGIQGLNKHFPEIDLEPYHPIFRSELFRYSPEKNTNSIREIITNAATAADSDPFFILANYMDTHSPYWPAEQFQVNQFGERIGFKKVRNLNNSTMLPFPFAERVQDGYVDEDSLNLTKKLYSASVRSADYHLESIYRSLCENGLDDNTMLIVTSDHGEMLGEYDELGRRRMGHVDSVGDHLLKVPLLIANPTVANDNIEELVNIKSISGLISNYIAEGSWALEEMSSQRVIVESPASNATDIDEYRENLEGMVERTTSRHTVVGYEGNWKAICYSNGDNYVYKSGKELSVRQAPDGLIDECQAHLEALPSNQFNHSDDSNDIDSETKSRLDDLGYLT